MTTSLLTITILVLGTLFYTFIERVTIVGINCNQVDNQSYMRLRLIPLLVEAMAIFAIALNINFASPDILMQNATVIGVIVLFIDWMDLLISCAKYTKEYRIFDTYKG